MVFSSTIFVFLFLPLVLIFYFLSPNTTKNGLLLGASLLFYAWGEGILVLLLLFSTVFNYNAARLIERYLSSYRGYFLLITSICANLSLLGYYKYGNFIVDNLQPIVTLLGFSPIEHNKIHLPIGISFFTFQSISYLVDIHRGTARAQHKFIDAALYISLFPQLIAGPIIRYHDVARQLGSRVIDLDRFSEGIRRFIIGLAKKVLIANPLGFVADQVFAIPATDMTTELAWLGITCYTLQIYFDFSGYSDMAIGLGKLFGFQFLENFNYPYVSRSIREFWRRWHISLSNWFRDYLYIPLGGNRGSNVKTYVNLVLVFLLCGLWHGASWTFAFWGIYHGLFLVIERIGFDRILCRFWSPVQHVYTLLVVVIGWVFFRSNDLTYAFVYLSAMFGMGSDDNTTYPLSMYVTNEIALTLLVGTATAVGIYNLFSRNGYDLTVGIPAAGENHDRGSRISTVVEPVYLLVLFVLVSTYLAKGTYNPFIYFRF